MKNLAVTALLIALCACGGEQTSTVTIGAYCDSCEVRIVAPGLSRDFVLWCDTLDGATHGSYTLDIVAEPGAEVMVSARPLTRTDTATAVWVRIDEIPSGFEWSLPDTTVTLSTTVPRQ